MSIAPIKADFGQFAPIERIIPDTKSEGIEKTKGEPKFSEMFSNAIKEVDSLQHEADHQIEGVTLGKDGYTTHGAMLALEKADAAFQLMNNIRAKIIRVYEDVLRTPI